MTLKVEIDFVSNRLSEEHLVTAYELALPLVSREIEQKKKRKRRQCEESVQTTLAVING